MISEIEGRDLRCSELGLGFLSTSRPGGGPVVVGTKERR